MNTIPSTEVGVHIDDLLQEAERKIVQITRHNKPKAAIMSYEVYMSLMETLEILSDSEMMDSIRQGEREIADGKCVDWEALKQGLVSE